MFFHDKNPLKYYFMYFSAQPVLKGKRMFLKFN